MSTIGGPADESREAPTVAPPPEDSTSGDVDEPPDPPVEASPGPDPTPPPELPDRGLDDLLLDERDLPTATVIGPMSYGPEPVYHVVDCAEMAVVFAAHEVGGRRVRSDLGTGRLRQSVVTMTDVASAAAVLDAADVVWERCPLVTTDTDDTWWIEPIEMPRVDGWRTSGLALGLAPELVWTIGWYQQGSVVVVADLDAANPWDLRREVDAAIAARLEGTIDPVEPGIVPTSTPTPTPAPEATAPPTPRPTSVPRPTPTPDKAWLDHPAARYLPEPDFFGPAWTLEVDRVTEAAPADPGDAIDGCDVQAPPTMSGLEVSYHAPADDLAPEVEVLVGVGDEAAARATMASFRGLTACTSDLLDDLGVTLIEVRSSGADEVVVLEFSDRATGEPGTLGRFAIARYGPDLLGVAYGGYLSAPTGPVPESDTLVAWLDQWAGAAAP